MYRIRRFGVIKTATVVAVMYVIIIAVFALPIAVGVALFGRGDTTGGAAGVLAFGLVVAVLYAVLGWVFTAIACALYNFAAGMVGGIEVEVEPVAPPPPAPVWGPTGAASPPTALPPTAPPPTEPPAG
jgi:Transmembrane domain of unknown function (DUF3566)